MLYKFYFNQVPAGSKGVKQRSCHDCQSETKAITDWQKSSKALLESMNGLFEILEDAKAMGGVK